MSDAEQPLLQAALCPPTTQLYKEGLVEAAGCSLPVRVDCTSVLPPVPANDLSETLPVCRPVLPTTEDTSERGVPAVEPAPDAECVPDT